MSSADTSSPSVSMAPAAGMYPMGVSVASPVPLTRSNTHSSTREFSP